jgi:hypothetical protein
MVLDVDTGDRRELPDWIIQQGSADSVSFEVHICDGVTGAGSPAAGDPDCSGDFMHGKVTVEVTATLDDPANGNPTTTLTFEVIWDAPTPSTCSARAVTLTLATALEP